jgi:hypothetical protein
MNYFQTKKHSLCLYVRRIVVIFTACVLLNAAPAFAAIILQVSPGAQLPQGNLVRYTVNAVGTQGEVINTFSRLHINPVSGPGIHNVAQVLTNSGTPTKQEHAPGIFSFNWAAYDSYFLFDNTEMLSLGPNFMETNDGTTSGNLGISDMFGRVPRSGFGIYSSDNVSAKAVLAPNADDSVPFMQVVLRAQDSARLSVRLEGNAGTVSGEPQIIIGPFVPEPSTVSLLAVSSLGLVVRRRCAGRR